MSFYGIAFTWYDIEFILFFGNDIKVSLICTFIVLKVSPTKYRNGNYSFYYQWTFLSSWKYFPFFYFAFVHRVGSLKNENLISRVYLMLSKVRALEEKQQENKYENKHFQVFPIFFAVSFLLLVSSLCLFVLIRIFNMKDLCCVNMKEN